MPKPIAAIVLAAGTSQRMGDTNKLIQTVDGKPVLRRVVEAIIQAGIRKIYVVTGHQAAEVETSLQGLPLTFVFNENYREGMGTSIACGVNAVEDANFQGVALCLGDLARIVPATVQRVASAFHDNLAEKIVAPSYNGKRGHPVIFPIAFLAQLRQFEGDRGAKSLIGNNSEHLEIVNVSDPSVTTDFDTPDDFKHT